MVKSIPLPLEESFLAKIFNISEVPNTPTPQPAQKMEDLPDLPFLGRPSKVFPRQARDSATQDIIVHFVVLV